MEGQTITLQVAKRGLVTIPQALRERYHIQTGDVLTLVDLGGVFVLAPGTSEIDRIADQVAAQWTEDGQTLETMLQALRDERDRRAR